MSDSQYAVILVYSTSHAMRLESLLKRVGVPNKLIPVPRQVSSDCGVCVRINRTDIAIAKTVTETENLEIEGIHNI